MDDVSAELRKRFTDPADLAKAEDFRRRYERRMERLGPNAGPAAMLDATRRCWRKAFSAEWPATRAASTQG